MNMTPAALTPHPVWHACRRNERHLSWKFFLPVTPGIPVLAVGLSGSELASLGRSWDTVHVWMSHEKEIEGARAQGASLGQKYRFEKITKTGAKNSGYRAIAVKGDPAGLFDPQAAFRLLEPGGTAAWVGQKGSVPSKRQLSQQGFHEVRAYAPLRSPSGNTIIIPLDENRATLAGLGLMSPLRRHNRWALNVCRLGSFAGAQGLLCRERLMIARKPGQIDREEYFTERVGMTLGDRVNNVSVYTGWTKLIIQLLDRQSRIIGFSRVADTPFGRLSIDRECAALQSLEDIAEMEGFIPKVIHAGEWRGHTVLTQTTPDVGRRYYAGKLTPVHLAFLKRMSHLERKEAPIDRWPHWETLRRFAKEGPFPSAGTAQAFIEAVNRSADWLANRDIPLHRVHGDFSPMHALLGSQGLAVIDWEGSEPDGLPLFDAVHFSLAPLHYTRGNRNALVQRMVDSRFLPYISPEVEKYATSQRFDPEINRLANLYAYMVITNPLSRFARWNR